MHPAPVVGTLPVPLMERRALRTKTESGIAGRHQPHDQRQHSTNQHTSSSITRSTPITSSVKPSSTSSVVRHPLCQQIEVSLRRDLLTYLYYNHYRVFSVWCTNLASMLASLHTAVCLRADSAHPNTTQTLLCLIYVPLNL